MTEVVKSPDGWLWSVGDNSTDDHLALGGHEPALGPVLQSLLWPYNETAYVNIGAHVGTWAVRMSKYASEVFAVEANPKTIHTLITNIDLNGLGALVTPVGATVWDRAFKKVKFVDVNGKETGGSTRVEVSPDGIGETTTLDLLFFGYQKRIGLISMDVEGAEARVLKGARGLIAKHMPNMLIELHQGHPGTDPDLREQVYALLDELGYTYFSLFDSPPEEHLVCRPANLVVDEPVKG